MRLEFATFTNENGLQFDIRKRFQVYAGCNFRPHFPGKILQYPRLIKRLLCLPGVATPSLHPLASLHGYPAFIRNLITKMKTNKTTKLSTNLLRHM